MEFPSLQFPAYPFRIKEEQGKSFIFDDIRKKYIVLTPEEWVRQHVIQYLIQEKSVPSGLMAVEISLKYHTLAKRADILVYNNNSQPMLMVECKAPEVTVTQETFDQLARYNMGLKVKYLMVTNGIHHYCCRMNYTDNSYVFLPEMPDYKVF